MQFYLGQFVRVVSAKAFGKIDGVEQNPGERFQYYVMGHDRKTHYLVNGDDLVDATKAMRAIKRGYLPISNSKKWIGRLTAPIQEGYGSRAAHKTLLREKGTDILKVDPDTYRCLQQLWAEAPNFPVPYKNPLPGHRDQDIGERVNRKAISPFAALPTYSGGKASQPQNMYREECKPSEHVIPADCKAGAPTPEFIHKEIRALQNRVTTLELKSFAANKKVTITNVIDHRGKPESVLNWLSENGHPGAKRVLEEKKIQTDEKRVNELIQADEKARKIEIRAERLKKISGYLKHHVKYGTPQRDLDRLAYFLYRLAHGRK
jgi:hypothetical protein